MSKYEKIDSNDLIEELDKLKQILNDPEKYIWEYFNDIQNEIDLEFEEILASFDDSKRHLMNNLQITWIDIINKLTEFKTECMNNIQSFQSNLNEFNSDLNNLENKLNEEIASKVTILNWLTNKKSKNLNSLKHLIQTKGIHIKKKLFVNKTLLYMNRHKCNKYEKLNDLILSSKEDESFQKLIGRLIIVSDYFIENIDYINIYMRSQILNEQLLKNYETKIINEIKLMHIEKIDLSMKNFHVFFSGGELRFLNFNIETSSLFNEFTKIHTLDLNFCCISKLQPDIFDCLATNLKALLLSSAFSDLNSTIFSKLTNLVELGLDYNDIISLESNIFDKLVKLEILKLNSNHKIQLNKRLFKYLSNLKSIDLSDNRIKQLPSDLFEYNSKLEEIYLSDNEIKILDQNQFKDLNELKILTLDRNRLERIDKNVFSNLDNLEILSLSRNNFKCLNSDEFEKVGKKCQIYLKFPIHIYSLNFKLYFKNF